MLGTLWLLKTEDRASTQETLAAECPLTRREIMEESAESGVGTSVRRQSWSYNQPAQA